MRLGTSHPMGGVESQELGEKETDAHIRTYRHRPTHTHTHTCTCTQDYLRDVTVTDIDRCIKPFVAPIEEDAALKVGALGPHYTEMWQREDAAMAVSLATTKTVAETASPQKKASTSRKKLAQCSPTVRRQRAKGASMSILISPTTLKDPDKELCHCCWHGDVSEGNEILFCDRCDVAVHQWCYDVKDIPKGQWFCRSCEYVMERTAAAEAQAGGSGKAKEVKAPVCAICLRPGGALAKTTSVDENGEPRWAHIFCCTTLPEMYVPDSHTDKTLFCGLDEALAERSSLTCSICKVKGGACVQCSHGNCTVSYHPLCCRDAKFRIEDRIENETESLARVTFCPKHAKLSSLRRSIIEREDNEEDNMEEDEEENRGTGADGNATTTGAQAVERKTTVAGIRAAALGSSGTDLAGAAGAGPSATENALNAKEKAQSEELKRYGMGNLSILFKQLISLGATTEQKVAEEAKVDMEKLRLWLAGGKAANEVEDIEGAISAWLIAFVDEVKQKHGIEGKGVGPAAIRAALYGDLYYGEVQPIEEAVNPYLAAVLDMPRNARRPAAERVKIEELGDANGSDEQDGMDLAQEGHNDAAGVKTDAETGEQQRQQQRETRTPTSVSGAGEANGLSPLGSRHQDGGLPSDETLSIAPNDEILAEILYYQTQLLDVTVENRSAIFTLLSELEKAVPTIVADRVAWDEGTKSVEQYLEMQRESRRLLKREKREKDQQAVNARLQAAALSSRGAAGRGGPATFIKRHLRGRPSLPDATQKLAVGASAYNEDDLCRVCFSADSSSSNVIVFCERCGTPVHQRCYSISRVPKGDWLCWPCREYEKEHGSHTRPPRWARDKGPLQNKAQCALCPIPFGAMKRDTSTNSWIHVACAQWHPEISMRDFDASNAFMGSDSIDKSRRGLRCCVCGSDEGACITCDHEVNGVKCTKAFHPLCALEKGFDMSVIEDATGKLEYSCYCGTHSVSDGRDMDSLFKDEPVLMEKPSSVMNPNLPLAAFRSGQSIVETKVDPIEHRSKDDIASMEKLRVKLERLKLLCERIVKREQIKLEITKAGRDLALNRLKNPIAAADLLVSAVYPKDGATQSALASTRGMRYNARTGAMPVLDGIGSRRAAQHENGSRGGRHQNGQSDGPSLRRGANAAAGVSPGAATPTGGPNLKKRRRGPERDGTDFIQRRMTKEMADDTNTKLPEGYLYVPLSRLSRDTTGGNANDGARR